MRVSYGVGAFLAGIKVPLAIKLSIATWSSAVSFFVCLGEKKRVS